MSGTDVGYAATRSRMRTSRPRSLSAVTRRGQVKSAISLRACYAMSGTDIAYAAANLPTHVLALSGTEIAYAATRAPIEKASTRQPPRDPRQVSFRIPLRVRQWLPTHALGDVRYTPKSSTSKRIPGTNSAESVGVQGPADVTDNLNKNPFNNGVARSLPPASLPGSSRGSTPRTPKPRHDSKSTRECPGYYGMAGIAYCIVQRHSAGNEIAYAIWRAGSVIPYGVAVVR
eukprot:39279-Rhodomonas_salina.3